MTSCVIAEADTAARARRDTPPRLIKSGRALFVDASLVLLVPHLDVTN